MWHKYLLRKKKKMTMKNDDGKWKMADKLNFAQINKNMCRIWKIKLRSVPCIIWHARKRNEPNRMKKYTSNPQFEAQRKIPWIIKNCLYQKNEKLIIEKSSSKIVWMLDFKFQKELYGVQVKNQIWSRQFDCKD